MSLVYHRSETQMSAFKWQKMIGYPTSFLDMGNVAKSPEIGRRSEEKFTVADQMDVAIQDNPTAKTADIGLNTGDKAWLQKQN